MTSSRRYYFAVYLSIVWLMSSANSEYSGIQFSPTGRIIAVENAKLVASKGSPVIALRCEDGILIAAGKRLPKPKLAVESQRAIFQVDSHICLAVTGYWPHALAVADLAKQKCE